MDKNLLTALLTAIDSTFAEGSTLWSRFHELANRVGEMKDRCEELERAVKELARSDAENIVILTDGGPNGEPPGEPVSVHWRSAYPEVHSKLFAELARAAIDDDGST